MGQMTAAEHLIEACQAAFDRYPDDCSRAVHQVMKTMLDENIPYRTANELMYEFSRTGSNWRQVQTLQEAYELANQGRVVVGGLANPGGNGHVLIVMPGRLHPDGGFLYNGFRLRSHGEFPPALSTSLGRYPGAMSRGEKTVRDPWTASDWPKVTFWINRDD